MTERLPRPRFATKSQAPSRLKPRATGRCGRESVEVEDGGEDNSPPETTTGGIIARKSPSTGKTRSEADQWSGRGDGIPKETHQDTSLRRRCRPEGLGRLLGGSLRMQSMAVAGSATTGVGIA